MKFPKSVRYTILRIFSILNKRIFSACAGRPRYVTSYRTGENIGMTDEECVELLLLALECGATLFDVMGDLYDRPFIDL